MSSEHDVTDWDNAADAYVARIGPDGDTFFRGICGFLNAQLGEVAGRDVLDPGCGHGWVASSGREARVVGIRCAASG
ncbi:MAG: hypothetical protein WKF57_22295 [Nakamurella sp.]